ncbi:MAG: DUF1223 domain-containing protein [Rhodospirillaceae bacterium]|jgi:hypothetical protein|nr:DUF1223 domain-containing protein [Rhodospirillaceae bacterium]MBT5945602.1 DUF1223 domain-containing protein [Rhodospirillaceae bacterium]MBT6403828.1 DUF1223 domain-containing protein [Rhodospirillaceae bacterium]MBT6536183.1 DUF1223 domain-containing protein [Rhodospirillaceae bacterium]MBT7362884.1 DUF1223 domain-containing protein [Rhodospirillaceae bacterium]
MRAIRVAVGGLVLAGALHAHGPAVAEDDPLTVVELFTSQSCYSCPPAEAYLGELSDEKNILALEYHVDYWDTLNYGRHGRWKDAFSTPEMTQRQRDYNAEIRNTRSVYTPQMVVDGRTEAVGSRRRAVQNLISKARADDQPRVAVDVSAAANGGVTVSVGEVDDTHADVWLVTFIREVTTQVVRGENHGKTLTSHNIVRNVRHIGEWDGKTTSIDVSDLTLEEGQSCAILVQDGKVGPVLGAAYCPAGVGGAAS